MATTRTESRWLPHVHGTAGSTWGRPVGPGPVDARPWEQSAEPARTFTVDVRVQP